MAHESHSIQHVLRRLVAAQPELPSCGIPRRHCDNARSSEPPALLYRGFRGGPQNCRWCSRGSIPLRQ
ncbi:hypothetical protein KCP70_07480 [Salmonella enterica subsp. enterica]|nr:hypothetical protein KCP70_07480 [Salmonella enterica subsp. enterica]